jgi:NADH-quinone oxidoreductase subunit L
MTLTTLVIAALLLPALSFLILAVVAPLRRTGFAAGALSSAFAATSLFAAIAAWRGVSATGDIVRFELPWLPTAGESLASIGVLADADSSLMLILVALVATLVQIYSLAYLHDEKQPSLGRYYAYQSLFAFSMMGLVLAPNLLQLFICWELVGLCSYLLVGFWYQKPSGRRRQATRRCSSDSCCCSARRGRSISSSCSRWPRPA